VTGTLEDVLTSLERMSAEMARADGPPLAALIPMIARRQILVERIAAFQPLHPDVRDRLAGLVRSGAIIAGRLNVERESLRREIESLARTQRFAEGVSHTVPESGHRVNTRG
jgi:hypothetical protein